MNRPGLASFVALGLVVLGQCGQARAQVSPFPPYSPMVRQPVIGPFLTPGLSPYLNLLRGGSPAANYYLGVVPERQRRIAEAQLGSAVLGLEVLQAAPPAESLEADDLLPRLRQTGHPAVFNNTAGYFSTGFGPRYPGPTTGGAQRPGTTPPSRGSATPTTPRAPAAR